ncbi:MAG: hypothetical protein QM655_10760 [Nocardioidaceae bacterium]
MKKRMIGVAAAGAVAATSAVVVAAPAWADGPERHAHGKVGGARYDIDIEKEHGTFEISVDLDDAPANSSWKLVVRHEGKKVGVRHASARYDDGEYEVDFRDVHSANTPGKDTFKVKIVRTDDTAKVTRTLQFAR